MAPDLPDDARELIEHFADLPADDRARVLALVRSLSFCRIAELYSSSWPEACLSRVAPGDPARPGLARRPA